MGKKKQLHYLALLAVCSGLLSCAAFHSADYGGPRPSYRPASESLEKSSITDRRPASSKPDEDAYALRQDVVDFSKQYLGLKYRRAGRSPETGFDCSGFTCYIFDKFSIDLSPSSQTQATQGLKIDVKDSKAGDIVIFGKKGRIHHVGLVVENTGKQLFVIHSSSRGVVIDDIYASGYWRPRIMYARDVISDMQEERSR